MAWQSLLIGVGVHALLLQLLLNQHALARRTPVLLHLLHGLPHCRHTTLGLSRFQQHPPAACSKGNLKLANVPVTKGSLRETHLLPLECPCLLLRLIALRKASKGGLLSRLQCVHTHKSIVTSHILCIAS